MAPLAEVVRGNFLSMPFAANTFDAAYAIEATCHADKLEEVREMSATAAAFMAANGWLSVMQRVAALSSTQTQRNCVASRAMWHKVQQNGH